MAADLPTPAETPALLARLGVPDEAIADIESGRPTPGSHEAEQLEAFHRQLTTTLEPTFWPGAPLDAAPTQRWLQLWAVLAAIPHGFEVNAARGIPESITWDTLLDVGVQVQRYLSAHGRPGFDGAWWVSQHVRGQIYRLGRLSFNTWAVGFEPDPDAGFAKGDPALGVHIPATGPLTPEACDAAFDQAREFFPRHLPDEPFRVATCQSWLLDEQLRTALPADSNIIRFQTRFTPVANWSQPGDEDVLRFVFGNPSAQVAQLPTNTRLERFIVEKLRGGGHFQVRAGWIRM